MQSTATWSYNARERFSICNATLLHSKLKNKEPVLRSLYRMLLGANTNGIYGHFKSLQVRAFHTQTGSLKSPIPFDRMHDPQPRTEQLTPGITYEPLHIIFHSRKLDAKLLAARYPTSRSRDMPDKGIVLS